jgi:hypothetical protein
MPPPLLPEAVAALLLLLLLLLALSAAFVVELLVVEEASASPAAGPCSAPEPGAVGEVGKAVAFALLLLLLAGLEPPGEMGLASEAGERGSVIAMSEIGVKMKRKKSQVSE